MNLTARQAEVLELLAAGKKPRAAAKVLGIARETVIGHLFDAAAKLGAKTSFQAMAIFAREKVKEEI